MFGKYKSDRDGFTKAFFELHDNATYDTNAPYKDTPLDTRSVIDEINEDREFMTHELAHQLSLRVREHLYLKERKASDLAKPRRSEIGTFAS